MRLCRYYLNFQILPEKAFVFVQIIKQYMTQGRLKIINNNGFS